MPNIVFNVPVVLSTVDGLVDALKRISNDFSLTVDSIPVKCYPVNEVMTRVIISISGKTYQALGTTDVAATIKMLMPQIVGDNIKPAVKCCTYPVFTYPAVLCKPVCKARHRYERPEPLDDVPDCCKKFMLKVEREGCDWEYCPICGEDLDGYADGDHDLSFLD